MVMVRVSETYDLSTKVDKMGLVGIHTPTGPLISKLWGGLIAHYKKFRFVKCDVAMACASMLPADPLQVGVEAGSIAPQDMFNPILYKAVSNDSMSNILAYIQSYRGGGADSVVDKGSVLDINDANFTDSGGTNSYDQFQMYYALLADSDNWRKAMPQSGLVMNGLYPLVYQVVSNYGSANSVANPLSGVAPSNILDDPEGIIPAPNSKENDFSVGIVPNVFRGPSMRMPAIDTNYFTGATGTAFMQITTMDGNTMVIGDNSGSVPPAYVGLIVLPPARLNQLYYRLKVTWTIEFTGLRTLNDVATWGNLARTGATAYGTDYDVQSASMSAKTAMVDSSSADISKIMEGI